MKKILIGASLSMALYANAFNFDFKVGPKIGLGAGKIFGIKGEGGKNGVIGVPVGVLFQMDQGSFNVEAGLNYQFRAVVTSSKVADLDGDGKQETSTVGFGLQSLELPITANYLLKTDNGGFWKFGGGAAVEYGIGKIRSKAELDNTTAADQTFNDTQSYTDSGVTKFDVLLLANVGYQWNFEKWSLSLDLTPKYGLINRGKKDAVKNPENSAYHTFVTEFTAAFLF